MNNNIHILRRNLRCRGFGRAALVAFLAALITAPVSAEVFKFVDGKGVTHYTNIRPQRSNYSVVSLHCIHRGVRCGSSHKYDWSKVPLNRKAFETEVRTASRKYDVDSSLIRAVIHAESSFDPLAVSVKGAQGLMQLMPVTQTEYKVRNAFSASANIDGGTRIIRDLMKRYGKDTRLVLAAYHAGPGAVQKYHGVPPYASTREYIGRVTTLQRRYQRG